MIVTLFTFEKLFFTAILTTTVIHHMQIWIIWLDIGQLIALLYVFKIFIYN